MKLSFIFSLIMFIVWILLVVVLAYVIYLIIRAFKKYIKSAPVRKESAENAKTLGEVLKQNICSRHNKFDGISKIIRRCSGRSFERSTVK